MLCDPSEAGSSRGESAIRTDLCEKFPLCHLLCGQRSCGASHFALMALMLFHAARLDARLDARGAVLLIDGQDRSKWDVPLIHRAERFLDRSAEGTVVSPYHLEAGIALHHCSARSYAETNWPAILRLYDALVQMHPSPIYLLNRAIVVAEIDGPEAGIRALERAANDRPACTTISLTPPWENCIAARQLWNEPAFCLEAPI